MVGLSFGKAVALARGLPLVAVNHLEGHAVSARLGRGHSPIRSCCCWCPAAIANCWSVEGVGACRRLGSTLDDAAGEAFDKIAKALGLPYPGGPALERPWPRAGTARPSSLPRMLLGREKTATFSFSGLKTAAARLARGGDERTSSAAILAACRSGRHRSTNSARENATAPWLAYAKAARGQGPALSWSPGASPPTRTVRAHEAGGHSPNRAGFILRRPAPGLLHRQRRHDRAGRRRAAGAGDQSDPLDAPSPGPRWPLDATAALANSTSTSTAARAPRHERPSACHRRRRLGHGPGPGPAARPGPRR